MTIKVIFDDGYYIITDFNGTFQEAEKYYLSHKFNIGTDCDNIRTAVKIELQK